MPAINVPFVAAMSASGTAALETVQADTYAFTASADIVYKNTLPADVIAAFVLSEEAALNGTVALNVTMSGRAAFATALKGAIDAAELDSQASPLAAPYAATAKESLVAYLQHFAASAIDGHLADNGIPGALEANMVKNMAVSVASQAGAEAMYDGLAGLSGEVLRLVATQIPKANYPEVFSSALPINSGDSMVFRFNITNTVTVSEDAKNLTTLGGADGAQANGSGPGVVGPSKTAAGHYTVGNRVLELILTKA